MLQTTEEEGKEKWYERAGKKLSELSPTKIFSSILDQVDALETLGSSLNKNLGLTKDRIIEIKTALADTIPDFAAIGGSAAEAEKVLSELATASRRSMIASDDLAVEMFAASKMLGREAGVIAEAFMEVGIGLEKIPEELADSMAYVRSIGGNANTVTASVLDNMDKINRFQFEKGVLGFTKMAAQASMLRFDMSQTFALADKALDPEGAIELSSAFQRLGISAGNLVDPFQLMQQSITDPQGLQDSLIQVSKQFTSFNEKTKKFELSRQGLLTLRELEKQTGMTGLAGELTKAGLAAAELDDRLAQINPRIKFESEEDKQYLVNIAKMGEGGEYIVKTKDEGYKKLSEITEEQFKELIEEQKKQPKDLTEVAYKQLELTEKINAGIAAMVDNITLGAASSEVISKELVGVENIIESTLQNVQRNVETIKSENVRELTDDALKGVAQLLDDFRKGKITKDTLNELTGGIKNKFQSVLDGLKSDASKVLGDAKSQTTGGSLVEGAYNSLIDVFQDGIKLLTKSEQKIDASKTVIEGTQPIKSGTNIGLQQQNMKVEFDNLDMNLKLSLPDSFKGLSAKELEETLAKTFDSNEFKEKIKKVLAESKPNLKQSVSPD